MLRMIFTLVVGIALLAGAGLWFDGREAVKGAVGERLSFAGVVSVGAFVAMVELPCTGGPYLAITALLARSFDLQALGFLVVYNLVFVLPLAVIVALLYSGAAAFRLKRWRQENRKWMNLASGCLMLALGGFLIAYYGLGWYL